MLADAEGHARASTQLIVEGGTRDVKLVLAVATPLTVKVTDEAHVPLADATVLVTTADPLPFGALSDAQGVAQLLRLGAPPFTVKVSAPGYETVTRSGVSGTVEVALRRLGSFTVHVKSAGRQTRRARQRGDRRRHAVASPQHRGRRQRQLQDWRALGRQLRLSRQQRPAGVARLDGRAAGARARQEITLTLEPGRFVTALVTDGSGAEPAFGTERRRRAGRRRAELVSVARS